MAKRAEPDEQHFRPLIDKGLISAALSSKKPVERFQETETPARVAPAFRQESSPSYAANSEDKIVTPVQRPSVRLEPVREKPYDDEKRILLARSDTRAIDRIVNRLADRLQAPVKFSHVMRALTKLLVHAESEIDARAGEVGVLVRPPNGDSRAIEEFDIKIAGIIGLALRDAGSIR
jgi:hypothetical protein